MNYTDINSKTIDQWIEDGWEWGRPIDHQTFEKAQNGEWQIVLTPTRAVPKEWYPELKGCKVLGLASGGGQQMPILTAAGAECTVLDYSEKQLESEKMVAEREGYTIELVRADMTKPLPFEDETFDMILHPVSNCYVEEVLPIWRECYRILKKGGRLLAGLDNGFNFLFNEDDEKEIIHTLPYNPLKNPELYAESIKNNWGIQFSHTLDEQIRGQIQAGFTLRDLYEDTDGFGLLHQHGVPTFWATLAIKEN